MVEDFAFSEVVRKLANIIRIGKVSDIDGSQVKVQIGRVKTSWIPIISNACEDSSWLPISKDEQVAVFAPFGEFTQAFALRSIHYNNYPAPTEKDAVSMDLKHKVNITGAKECKVSFKEGLEIKVGNSSLKITDKGISLNCGNSYLDMDESTIRLDALDVRIDPPVCKCGGF